MARKDKYGTGVTAKTFRKFGGEKFRIQHAGAKKTCQREASRVRSKGYKARIVKHKKHFTLYIRHGRKRKK